MRTRLQMSPEEARLSRDTMVRDMSGLAYFFGAPTASVEALDQALGEKHGRSLHAKEAHVPRMEHWEIRFLRCPGGWLTTGRRLRPEPTDRVPGSRLPRYVKLVVPLRPDGVLPMSLAPRRQDLPRVAAGRWRYVSAQPHGYHAPLLTVEVQAPRYGVIIYSSGYGGGPLIVRFPANKASLGVAVRRLAAASLQDFDNRRRRVREKAVAARRPVRGAQVLPVPESRAV